MKCRKCDIILTKENCSPSFLKRNLDICRKCNEKQNKDRVHQRRLLILERLGNKCGCCGINKISLLSIDHINGGGHKECKSMNYKKYISILYKMPLEELISKYQCLCFNCNYAKGFWGSCPHTWDKNEEL